MSHSRTINTISGKLILDKGDWSYITSARFYSLDATINLTWESLDTTIAQINPNSGLIYAKNVGETTVIGISNDETITVLCPIKVQAKPTELVTAATSASTASVMPRCGGNCSGDITALGYSGTVFEYKIVGSLVTLEKGFGAKNGTSNIYSDLFRSALVQMDNIYASMTPDQRRAWLKLRVNDFIQLVGIFNPQSVSETAKNIAKQILSNYGIDLGGMLEATILGVYNWYLAEKDAVSYYNAF